MSLLLYDILQCTIVIECTKATKQEDGKTFVYTRCIDVITKRQVKLASVDQQEREGEKEQVAGAQGR